MGCLSTAAPQLAAPLKDFAAGYYDTLTILP